MPNNQQHDPRVSTPGERVAQAVGLSVAAVSGGVITGTIAEGESIVISPLSGQSFGLGPNNEFYLGSANAVAGENLTLSDPQVGILTGLTATAPKWESGGLYSRPKLSINNPESRAQVDFTPASEFFISSAVFIGQAIDTFSASYKLFWLSDGPDGFTSSAYDLVMLTKQNFTDRMAFQGNSSNGTVIETSNGDVPSGEWFYFSGWVKDNGSSEMGCFYQLAKSGSSVIRKTAPDTDGQLMFDGTGSTSVSRLNFIGDSNGDSSLVPTWLDYIYIASGDNARARVEIGDAEQYDSCTELFPCTVSNWASSITATIRHPSPSGKYLHIHKGDGVHENAGTGRAL